MQLAKSLFCLEPSIVSVPIQTTSTPCLKFEELDVDKDFTKTVLNESDYEIKACSCEIRDRRYEEDNVDIMCSFVYECFM